MLKIISLLFSLFLFSCTPQQRLTSLLKKHPELIKHDTIYRIDTIKIHSQGTDTVFHYMQTDTVIVKENGMTIKYFYNTKDSTVYLEGKHDTLIIIKEPVQINTVKVEKKTKKEIIWENTKNVLLLLLVGAVAALFFFVRTGK